MTGEGNRDVETVRFMESSKSRKTAIGTW